MCLGGDVTQASILQSEAVMHSLQGTECGGCDRQPRSVVAGTQATGCYSSKTVLASASGKVSLLVGFCSVFFFCVS